MQKSETPPSIIHNSLFIIHVPQSIVELAVPRQECQSRLTRLNGYDYIIPSNPNNRATTEKEKKMAKKIWGEI